MNDDVTTTIRASKALLDRIDELARQDGGMRTRSEALRWALKRGADALESDLLSTKKVPVLDLASELADLRERVAALERRV